MNLIFIIMDKTNYTQKVNSQYVSPAVEFIHIILEGSILAASTTGDHEVYKNQNVDDFWI